MNIYAQQYKENSISAINRLLVSETHEKPHGRILKLVVFCAFGNFVFFLAQFLWRRYKKSREAENQNAPDLEFQDEYYDVASTSSYSEDFNKNTINKSVDENIEQEDQQKSYDQNKLEYADKSRKQEK